MQPLIPARSCPGGNPPPPRRAGASPSWIASGRVVSRVFLSAALVAMQLAGAGRVRADVVPQTMNGVPLLPIPTYEEVGLPPFTMPTGTPSTGTNAPATGTGNGGTGTDGSGDGADSPAMTAMMSRSWGDAASQNAETVGVTAVSLAATCTIEASGCQTLTRPGSISGTFQMRDDTYTAMMNSALARNPNLAVNIVPGLAGKLDPATQSIAASEYLRQGAEYLQRRDVANPTVVDVRGYYNFGPGNAVAIAQANNSDLMSDQIRGLTAAQFRANGIEPGSTTVGQWRASFTNKIGQSAAQAPVLLARS